MKQIKESILDPELLRSAMRTWSAGVTVLTAKYNGAFHGMTVNSLASISLDPALVTVALKKSTRTHEYVMASGAFGVTMLAEDQMHISEVFAGRVPSEDRFAGLKLETLVTGSPFIIGGLAWLDCRISQTVDADENTLVIAEVVGAHGTGEGTPLVYHNRGYWKLTK